MVGGLANGGYGNRGFVDENGTQVTAFKETSGPFGFEEAMQQEPQSVNQSVNVWLFHLIYLFFSLEYVMVIIHYHYFSLQCIIQSGFKKPNEVCVQHPKNCKNGLAFSIWEKISYSEEVLDIYRSHTKKYIFSTGAFRYY